MKKLNRAVDRFAYSHPNFGIPNLMMYVVAGNVVVYLLTVFAGYGAVSFLTFADRGGAERSFRAFRLSKRVFFLPPRQTKKEKIHFFATFKNCT